MTDRDAIVKSMTVDERRAFAKKAFAREVAIRKHHPLHDGVVNIECVSRMGNIISYTANNRLMAVLL